jgi:hypothetical protein
MRTLVRRAAAVFFLAHGVAHLLGFLGSWRLGEFADAPYTTSVLNGAIDVGDVGVRIVGLLWVGAATGFIAAGLALWRGSRRLVVPAALFSLGVCVIGLPTAVVGVGIDVVILATTVALATKSVSVNAPVGDALRPDQGALRGADPDRATSGRRSAAR